MKKILFAAFICVLCVGAAFAQKAKPWSEWSKKDADKMLNDSAWGQSQTRGEGPVSIDKSQRQTQSTQANAPANDTASLGVYFRVRLITAKPIREGLGRKVLLAEANPTKELQDQVQAFIDRDFGDIIVVGVNVEGQDARMVGGILQGLGKLTSDFLKDKAYLERKDGKRLPLVDYKAPAADNMGAKFFFARTLDGQPFLSQDSDSARFVLKVSDILKLDVKFKVSGMMYGEKLEY